MVTGRSYYSNLTLVTMATGYQPTILVAVSEKTAHDITRYYYDNWFNHDELYLISDKGVIVFTGITLLSSLTFERLQCAHVKNKIAIIQSFNQSDRSICFSQSEFR